MEHDEWTWGDFTILTLYSMDDEKLFKNTVDNHFLTLLITFSGLEKSEKNGVECWCDFNVSFKHNHCWLKFLSLQNISFEMKYFSRLCS